ncbi:lateral tail fiber protein [Escherichia phage GeorgBuechner]|uniref:Lateral tail fiber protein n=1 Tax=Escherichia phage GeorgBuechner TaxID=2851980 RepID=A0AAE7VSB1_9CAUD|nr:lateral tail fiber protein [Escherichia phage GeorgBuechner]QXV79476.1 lateral tail fiber protein [Escherichia phage GeorgBuechner]
MAAGTLSVTNNSKAVVGVGTTFTAFKAGDFLSLVVGQVPYTVAIASIESATALTLVLPFDGPTATGLAWDGINRDTMSLATMGVTVQAQKALRLMIADENNWRAIFGDAEEITVTLPNGQVMQGMSWGYLSELLKNVDPVEMRDLAAQAEASKSAAQGFRNEAEGFKNDTNTIKTQTNQIKADTQAIHDATNTIKTQTNQIKTDTQAIKDQTNQIKTDTGVMRDEANTAKADAQAASTAAQEFRDQAEEWAQSVNADNLLTKSGNLAGLADKTESWANLMPAGPLRVGGDPNADLDAATKRWTLGLLDAGTANTSWSVINGDATKPPAGTTADGGSIISEYRVGTSVHSEAKLRVRATIGGETYARLAITNLETAQSSGIDFNTKGEMTLPGKFTVNSPGSDVVGSLSLSRGSYLQFAFEPYYTVAETVPNDVVGGRTFFEPALVKSGTRYFRLFMRRKDGNRTGEIMLNFPTTVSGTIALQGTSGREYKKDIADADASEAMDRINSQRLVNFVYKDDEQARQRFGIIAEEAELIAPQYVKHHEFPIEDILDEDGNKIGEKMTDRPSIDVNPIVMDLMGCVQYLNKQVEDLKAEIAALKK